MVTNVVFVVPGRLDTPTGGYAYDRRVIAELRQRGLAVAVIDVGADFPFPSSHTKANAEAALMGLPEGAPVVVDGLALGALPEAAAGLSAKHRLIALVHHPLALESGLTAMQAARLRTSERMALSHAHRVIVTSAMTGRTLAADFDVPPERIAVARPGCDPVSPTMPRDRSRPHLLSVGTLTPRKGHAVLLTAVARLRDLDWRLTITGERRDPETATQIDNLIATLELSERVTLMGAVDADELRRLYADADVFVLASRFEGYGMAYADAIAYGLPIVGTTGGAIPEVVPPEAGILVAPDDAVAFAAALRSIIGEDGRRKRYAEGARSAAVRLPTWAQTAKVFVDAVGAMV